MRTLEAVKHRLLQCKLEIKNGKSNIVYCKRNQKKHPPFAVHYVSFDFLGFTFKPRMVKGYFGHFHLGFTPSISRKRQKRINQTLFKMKLHRMVHLRLSDLAGIIAAKVRGWIHYYGKVRMSELHYVFRFLNMRLAKWVRNKSSYSRSVSPRVMAVMILSPVSPTTSFTTASRRIFISLRYFCIFLVAEAACLIRLCLCREKSSKYFGILIR